MIFKNLRSDLEPVKMPIPTESVPCQGNSADLSVSSSSFLVENCSQEKEIFKKARKRRMRKIQKKRVLKRKEKEWAAFAVGLRDSVDRNKNVLEGRNFNSNSVEIEVITEAKNETVSKAMSPDEICDLGERLGVITKENKSMVLSRIKEFEGLSDSGEKVQQVQVNQ